MLPQRQTLRRRRAPPPSANALEMTGTYRRRLITLRDGREVTFCAIAYADATEIVQAFERRSAQSHYYRHMEAQEDSTVNSHRADAWRRATRRFSTDG